MNNKIYYGIYNDEDVLMGAVKSLREKGVKIKEVYSPFPIHGLDHALGLKRTRISITSFLYGITGLGLGLLMMWYMMVSDWPVNIGGKPNFTLLENLPSFVPVAFEITVLCAAHGMVITFLIRSRLIPGFKAPNPFPETTNDKFALELDRSNGFTKKEEVEELLQTTGVEEVKSKEV